MNFYHFCEEVEQFARLPVDHVSGQRVQNRVRVVLPPSGNLTSQLQNLLQQLHVAYVGVLQSKHWVVRDAYSSEPKKLHPNPQIMSSNLTSTQFFSS